MANSINADCKTFRNEVFSRDVSHKYRRWKGSMPKRSVYKESTSAWVLVGSLITLAIGIGLLWGSESLENRPILRSLSVNMGGLIVPSVALGVVWELLGKRRFVEEIFETASVSEAVRSAKVSVITTHFQEGVDWTHLMEGARELDVFVAAGRTWRSRLDSSLKSIASRSNAKINVILPDPTKPEVIKELARRFGSTEENVRQNIEDAEKYYRDLALKSALAKGGMRIWHFDDAPVITFYRIDFTYVLATYRHFGLGDVPTFVCHKGGSLATFVDEQIQNMLSKNNERCRLVHSHKDQTISAGTVQTDTASSVLRDDGNVPTG